MAWLVLTAAGLLEVAWAATLPATKGLTRPGPTALFVVALAASMLLLARATRTIPLGTAYTVWVGIGAVGTVIVGIAFYGDTASPLRLVLLAVLIATIVGIKVTAH